MKKYEHLVYSAIGLVALFLVLVAFNYSRPPLRRGSTSPRASSIRFRRHEANLRGLDAPVKVRLYISQGEHTMPVQLRSYAQRVEDLVREFKSVAGANLVVEKYNPQPDSERRMRRSSTASSRSS
jgi:hypothetical protein